MSKDRFKKNHFLVIKEAVDPKVANFVYNYFMMKRQVTKTFYDFKYVNPYPNNPLAPNPYVPVLPIPIPLPGLRRSKPSP